MTEHPSIKIENLTVCFQSNGSSIPVVRDTSIAFSHQNITGLIGESGCGKSVLAMSMLRMLPANASIQGAIYYDHENVLAMSKHRLKRYRATQLALIPQSPSSSLNPSHRIYKQTREGLRNAINKKWLPRNTFRRSSDIKASVSRVFEEIKLTEYKQSYPFQLSGGMRQRALSSMAVVRRPTWIIADEPTKGLDPELRQTVSHSLKTIAKQSNAGLIVISHDIPFTMDFCQQIAVMYAGQIVETGKAKHVINQPKHPYTQGLVDSLPQNGLKSMQGHGVALTDLPKGCAFHPRCRYRLLECCELDPPTYQHGNGRIVKCFLYRS